MLCGTSFACSVSRASPLFSFVNKIPLLLINQSHCCSSRLHFHFHAHISAKHGESIQVSHFLMNTKHKFFCSALSTKSLVYESSAPASNEVSNRMRKRAQQNSPYRVLRHKLDMCSKRKDIAEALRLYDDARSKGIQLAQYDYNILLYLCSFSVNQDDANAMNMGLKRGFEIFQQMLVEKVAPNEATFTSMARLAVAMEDPEMAFDLVKQMRTSGISPKLRSYGPALFGFCEKGKVDEAYKVDAHMTDSGVMAEEPELSALLKLSASVKNAGKVYELLHRLRASVRQVTESTLGIIEDWFKSEDAAKVGNKDFDMSKVRDGIVKGGGGWHGQGWIGIGKWKVLRTQVDEKGVCHSCGEKLVCIDIDPRETENFASSLTKLALQREVKADFVQFQEWLQQHGPFDAVIDGANMGLINQHTFNFKQLNTVVNKLRQMSPSKRMPLVILHRGRVNGGPAQSPNNKKLLDSWQRNCALYTTPQGSNDDWYWLYAAVSCNCLLVTNDEMRDHLFQLLGSSFFPRWKEKHQVRVLLSKTGVTLVMPPPYSIVIQESEHGSWHVPAIPSDDIETPRQWLCATRDSKRVNVPNI